MANRVPFTIPADIPLAVHGEYSDNYTALTRSTERLFLFVCDHHIEHGSSDFYGPSVAPDAHDPAHAFTIAAHGFVGAFATHPGLIARYGHLADNDDITYVAKITAKTSFIAPEIKDPVSAPLLSIDQVIAFKQESELDICAIGLTIYPGSEYEDEMLAYASNAIYAAHQHGLVTIAWIYPRGHALHDHDLTDSLITAVGIAPSLGADFVKIALAHDSLYTDKKFLTTLVQSAGNTKVLCAGGTYRDVPDLLKKVVLVLDAGFAGVAIGRNIFQRSLRDACALTQALEALIYGEKSYEQALALYHEHA